MSGETRVDVDAMLRRAKDVLAWNGRFDVPRDWRSDAQVLAGHADSLASLLAVREAELERLRRDSYGLRNVVGRWLRIRMEHPGQGIAGSVYPPITDPVVFRQLAADAEHSDLLARLFAGEEPLAYEEWRSRG